MILGRSVSTISSRMVTTESVTIESVTKETSGARASEITDNAVDFRPCSSMNVRSSRLSAFPL